MAEENRITKYFFREDKSIKKTFQKRSSITRSPPTTAKPLKDTLNTEATGRQRETHKEGRLERNTLFDFSITSTPSRDTGERRDRRRREELYTWIEEQDERNSSKKKKCGMEI